jgi:flagellar biosynthetic protein FliR
MISLTSTEINAWVVAFFFPLARILSFLVAAPPFNNAALNKRVRLFLGLAIAIAITPALPKIPSLDPASGIGLLILAQQMLIGFGMGFTMRLVFSAIDMGGNMISMQMGLGFATAYDPQNTAQTPVISEFIGMLALLIFMGIDGHLMLIATLTHSFSTLPISLTPPGNGTWLNLANAGVIVFSSGLLLALPVIVVLLITNLSLGILGRVAPQLNLMAVGFPLTLTIGLMALALSLSYLSAPLQRLFEFGLQSMLGYFIVPAPG